MTGRRRRRTNRRTYPTPYSLSRIGRETLYLVTLRRRRGYAIADASGTVVWTTPHPVSGRPMPMLEPDARRALRMAAEIMEATP